MKIRLSILFLVTLLAVSTARAACVNRFTRRADGSRHIVTKLTGKLTFQGAQALAAAIRAGKADPLEWVDAKGKTLARQFGELKAVRPIDVGCDGNTSGVIMIAAFPSAQPPGKTMIIRLGNERVVFEEQE